ncbi:hypothetical protein [Synoicihabitans lomoniglobus]|uniref:Neutral/alkaline non-lysosomal ceramidase N-terminal domain-containing protein n=1 Tax=Synoicihabitans lomoniglobus TaxID=2909285 RepID=A0AAF0CN61_9BACT|nr:hypothetical protein [Opitutaceae bacterium LMO-M01]WED65088.1 hypothetical protein PXH66_22345 [Opitutaceae bacterium LMO-M01]
MKRNENYSAAHFDTSRACVGAAPALTLGLMSTGQIDDTETAFAIAPFRFDVTPPLHHALLGGLVMSAIDYDDPLEAIGYVLLGAGAPIVVCAVDWAGLLNESHLAWRTALAAAAGTTPDRVAVHCVHQHNTPFVCHETRSIAATHPELPPVFELPFFESCLDRARTAVRHALQRPQPITHVAHGQATVHNVAANRRMDRDASGRVRSMRGSACTDPELRSMPEGLIDPTLQTIAFYAGARKVVSCHYYATHPMSYYRDGRVSSDFVGLARKQRQHDEPGCTQLYFTGCAGNVAAGKYNDGSPADRSALTQRVYDGIVASEAALVPTPLTTITWRSQSILPTPRPAPAPTALGMEVGAKAGPEAQQIGTLLHAFWTSWEHRVARQIPLSLSCLQVNACALLHLPGELFVEYQLLARALRPDRPVLVAAYGDGGPWYIPTASEYPAGGYEVSVAFSEPSIDAQLTTALRLLLA